MGKGGTNVRNKFSGGVAWYNAFDDSGALEGWVQLGYLGGGEFSDDTAEDKETDEDGVDFIEEGARSVAYDQKIRQRDPEHLKLATHTLRGKHFMFLKEESKVPINGKYQYLFAPYCKASPSLKWSRPGSELSFKVIIEENASAMTASSLPTETIRAGSLTAGMLTVGAKQFWDIISAS